MSDFFQNGVIATLQKLGERPLEEIETQLVRYSERQKILLVLPALFSEFEGPAMPHIVEQLAEARYLHRIVLSLDRANAEQFAHVKEVMSQLPMEVGIIWNDGPRILQILERLGDADFEAQQGKGRGVWLAIGYALTDKQVHTIALHDCDIVNYDREMLARLIFPIVDPGTDYEFSKGYYARANQKLHGRVTRLFFTPMVRALKRVQGPEHFFEFLDSFRYPLAGEFAFIRSLAKGIRIAPNWGLEISMLGEVFENTTVQRVCQVEIADTYEHKHQELSDSVEKGLGGMATDIATALFGIVATGGMILSDPFFNSLKAAYSQQARRAIENFNALASLNGLEYDRHTEIEAVEIFAEALSEAWRRFRDDPIGVTQMSAWTRIRAALPEISDQLAEAVQEDNR